MGRFALRNGLFHRAKRPISQRDSAHIANRWYWVAASTAAMPSCCMGFSLTVCRFFVGILWLDSDCLWVWL